MKDKPHHQPAPAPAARDDVKLAANRCPYCHDAVTPEESVVCQGCLARHHEACWREGGASCASCTGTTHLSARPKVEGLVVVCLALGAVGMGLGVLTNVLRGQPVSTVSAVCLGSLITSLLVTAGHYLQGRRHAR